MTAMSEPNVARELDITLERNSPVPLYYQLAQSIEQAINDGVLSPGDRLENELSLTTRLGLSRPTARQAASTWSRSARYPSTVLPNQVNQAFQLATCISALAE